MVASRVAWVDAGSAYARAKRRDEERPAGKPEELHDGREDTDHSRRGHDGQAVAAEHLSEEDGERGKQDGRQHEAVPEQLETNPARLEAAQNLPVGLRRISG